MTTYNQARKWHQRRQQALQQRDRDRQLEADRLASEANPPKYDGSRCELTLFAFQDEKVCPLGTVGCILSHDGADKIPAEVIEERQRAAKERERTRHLQD